MMRAWSFAGVVLCMGLVGCSGNLKPRDLEVSQVRTAQDLKAKMDGGNIVVVHALNAENYEAGHVPGAKNIDFDNMTEKDLPADKEITLVFYCAGPNCPVGEMAARKAASWGYKHVWVYKGGMSDWKASGMPVATGA